MGRIFGGLLFIFLDFNLNINTVTIGLIPDCIGYAILIGGLSQMAAKSGHFLAVKPFAVGMALYTAILYVMDLFGLSNYLSFISVGLGLLSTIVSLYISYRIVQGVKDMEHAKRCDLNGASLSTAWNVMAVFNILAYLSLIIPVLSVLFVIVCFIAGIVFLAAFHRAKTNYENRPNHSPL